jgi:hypothetical protein
MLEYNALHGHREVRELHCRHEMKLKCQWVSYQMLVTPSTIVSDAENSFTVDMDTSLVV